MQLPTIVSLCAVLAAAAAFPAETGSSAILEENEFYTVRRLTKEQLFSHKKRHGIVRRWTEIRPTNITFPEAGRDLVFDYIKGGDLLARDSVLNDRKYKYPVEIYYERTFKGYNSTAIRGLNFGSDKAYVYSLTLGTGSGYFNASILVPARKEVRVFVECYGFKK